MPRKDDGYVELRRSQSGSGGNNIIILAGVGLGLWWLLTRGGLDAGVNTNTQTTTTNTGSNPGYGTVAPVDSTPVSTTPSLDPNNIVVDSFAVHAVSLNALRNQLIMRTNPLPEYWRNTGGKPGATLTISDWDYISGKNTGGGNVYLSLDQYVQWMLNTGVLS